MGGGAVRNTQEQGDLWRRLGRGSGLPGRRTDGKVHGQRDAPLVKEAIQMARAEGAPPRPGCRGTGGLWVEAQAAPDAVGSGGVQRIVVAGAVQSAKGAAPLPCDVADRHGGQLVFRECGALAESPLSVRGAAF